MKVFGVLCTLFFVANANVVLYHRLFHPSFQNSKFLERGTISGDPPTLKASDSLAHDIETLSIALKNTVNPQDTLYQVAMTSEGVGSLSQLVYSSVKAVCRSSLQVAAEIILAIQCHLQQANAESWIIHATHDDVPFALDYFVSPVPSDGCPVFSSLRALVENMNTTILFKRPVMPPQ